MNETRMRMRLVVLLMFASFSLLVWIVPYIHFDGASQYLQVHFLDVGQGDAIFIETPDGVQVLIDGGVSNGVLRQLASEMSFFDRSIDMVIGTHPDSDHIGGLVDVLERYDVGAILRTENDGVSATWKAYTQAIVDEGTQVLFARQGQVFALGSSVLLKVLYPVYDASDSESNTSSIVLQIVYGDTEILLTGDSPKRIEEYLVPTLGDALQSDVLKVGHHGSRTSTSELFLDAVQPEFVAISAGIDNRYGHPHKEVIDMLKKRNIKTYNTAQEGTITFESDGKRTWRE